MFWDSAQPPEFVSACIARTAELNPGWTIVVVNPEDPITLEGLADPVPDGEPLDVAHTADWFRADALARHGGVWLDASNVPLLPIEHWVDTQSDALQGFGAPWDNTTMENWAFAAPYPCALMREWRDQFRRAIEQGFDAYNDAIPPAQLGCCLANRLPYLTQHAAWRVARHNLPSAPVRLMPSDGPGGPFDLLVNRYGGDSAAFGQQLLDLPQSDFDNTGFVKVRGVDRQYIGPLASYHGYLATTLTAALPDDYTSTYYEAHSDSWWIGLCCGVAAATFFLGICCGHTCGQVGFRALLRKRRRGEAERSGALLGKGAAGDGAGAQGA